MCNPLQRLIRGSGSAPDTRSAAPPADTPAHLPRLPLEKPLAGLRLERGQHRACRRAGARQRAGHYQDQRPLDERLPIPRPALEIRTGPKVWLQYKLVPGSLQEHQGDGQRQTEPQRPDE